PCAGCFSEQKQGATRRSSLTEANLRSDQIRHGPLSDGRSLRQYGGRLFVPVFLSGTGGPNTARRHRARPRGFSRGHRKDPETRTRCAEGRAVASDSAAEESLATSGLLPFSMGTGRRKDPSGGIRRWMAEKNGSGTRALEPPSGLATAHNLDTRGKTAAGRKTLEAPPGTLLPRVVRKRRSASPEFCGVQERPGDREDVASLGSCRSLPPRCVGQERARSSGRLFAICAGCRPAPVEQHNSTMDRSGSARSSGSPHHKRVARQIVQIRAFGGKGRKHCSATKLSSRRAGLPEKLPGV